jgi:8-oxo-dGTP diphosphatase
MPSIGPSTSSLTDAVAVVAATVADSHGNLLIACRPLGKHQGGKWEFPGGKIETGESAYEALRRELKEEVGISVEAASRLIQVPYTYPDKSVVLDVWQVTKYEGEAKGREGQQIRWVAPRELANYDFPAANRAIVAALTYPHLYAITDFHQYGEPRLLGLLEQAFQAGLSLVQLREHDLDKNAYLSLARKVIDLGRQYGARIMLNSEPGWIGEVEADGVHLTEKRLMELDNRPLDDDHLVAASCHNVAALRHAEEIGVDFVVLSPVHQTTSHPGRRPLGWSGFQEQCATTSVPVYALGGLALEDLETARMHGAQGVAMISGIWQSTRLSEKKIYL